MVRIVTDDLGRFFCFDALEPFWYVLSVFVVNVERGEVVLYEVPPLCMSGSTKCDVVELGGPVEGVC